MLVCLRRRLRDHGFSRRVFRKKVVVKFDNRKQNNWHVVRRTGGGQLSSNGVELYSVTSHKWYWAEQECICMKETRRMMENGPQIQCHGVGMHLLQRRKKTYQGGREYKCWQISSAFQEIYRIWQIIPLTYIKNLYDSIPRRIPNIIRLKGHLTKY